MIILRPDETVKDLKEFKSILNAVFHAKLGLSVDDLPDFCWADSFDEGMTRKAALAVCEELFEEQLQELT